MKYLIPNKPGTARQSNQKCPSPPSSASSTRRSRRATIAVATAALHARANSVAALFAAAATMHGRTRKTQKNPQKRTAKAKLLLFKKFEKWPPPFLQHSEYHHPKCPRQSSSSASSRRRRPSMWPFRVIQLAYMSGWASSMMSFSTASSSTILSSLRSIS